MDNSDNLPTHICLTCISKLVDAWEFRNLFIASDKFLHNNHTSVDNAVTNLPITLCIDSIDENNLKPQHNLVSNSSILLKSSIPQDLDWNEVDNELDYLDLDLDEPKLECHVDVVKKSNIEESTIELDFVATSEEENIENRQKLINDKNLMDNGIKNISSEERNKAKSMKSFKNKSKKNCQADEEKSIIFECKKCKKTLRTAVARQRHQNCHRKNKSKCPICSKWFSHTSNLKRHLLIHKEVDTLKCDSCNKSFNAASDLYEHIKIHWNNSSDDKNTEYLMQCDLCDEKTVSFALFYTHMRREHQITDKNQIKPFKCRICEMSFASKQGMFRHIDNIHENNRRNLRNRDKNFLCNTCGKSFYTNFHLDVHVRSHTGERPFKCEFCDKAFSQMSGLKMHTFIHTGEKPFRCKLCPKSFNQYGHVREHMLTHSDQRPHVCTVCNHSFRVKGNLTAHMLIHTGKKPYTCEHCGRRFLQSTKLKQHITKKHRKQEIENKVN